MNKNFIERLQYYMEMKGINDNQMTVAAGLSVGLLGKLKRNGKGMNSTNIEKILLSYPDLSPTWLLTGKGDMTKTAPAPLSKDDQTTVAIGRRSDRNEGIPLIPIDAMAGALSENSQTIMEYDCEHYVIPMFKGAEFLIPVKGDSMQPKYYSGDIVACKRLSLNTFFQWNRTYVIDSEQGVLIKRVKRGEDNDHITLVSDNPEYDPFSLEKSSIYSLALVIGVVRAE